MPPFDAADCLRRYHDLVGGQAELFVNPPGLVYEILAAAEEMSEAQEAARGSSKSHGLDVEDTRVGVLASDPYATVLREAVRFPDGSLGLYNRLLVPGGVVVLPVLRGSIVLIHRFATARAALPTKRRAESPARRRASRPTPGASFSRKSVR
jgi:ADP-ribose pyrophosphatase